MTDKEIFYSILGREIDNLLCVNPALSFLGGSIKKWVFNYIDPYVNFFMEGGTLKTDMATAFIQSEVNDKLKNFKQKFEEEVANERKEQ